MTSIKFLCLNVYYFWLGVFYYHLYFSLTISYMHALYSNIFYTFYYIIYLLPLSVSLFPMSPFPSCVAFCFSLFLISQLHPSSTMWPQIWKCPLSLDKLTFDYKAKTVTASHPEYKSRLAFIMEWQTSVSAFPSVLTEPKLALILSHWRQS